MDECTTCGSPQALLAVCDVLTVKALEAMGKWIVRADRSRFRAIAVEHLPLHEAHTRWPLDDEALIGRTLRGAWDVVPAMLDQHGCCGVTSRQVVTLLDAYVRDLAITGTAHRLGELRYRFARDLGLVVTVSSTADLVGAT